MCYSQFFFLTKLLTLRILFLTAVRALVVAKLVILGIFTFNLIYLALRVVLVAKLVISGILSSIFFILALYTSLFLNQQEQVLIHQHLIYLLYFSTCLN